MSKTHRVGRSGEGAGERGELLIGELIGDYRLKRLLGRGGMGLVFAGVHERMGHQAAIKVVRSQLAQSPLVAARFFTEARAASMLDHPGVVRVLDVGQTAAGMPFIVMEYLEGVLLTEQLSQIFSLASTEADGPGLSAPSGASHAEFALRIAGQLAETLSALHEKGVVHRDLKPDNIFLVHDAGVPGGERIKLFDFGIAKLLCEPGPVLPGAPGPGVLAAPQTAVGTVLGTPVYMSPEQWQGRSQISDRVDVYAAGGIFYEMLVGHPPFTARALGELMAQHLQDMPRPIRAEASWVPAPLEAMILRMLAKSPQHRPSMKEVAAFLACRPLKKAVTPDTATVRLMPTPPAAARSLPLSQAVSPAPRLAPELAVCQTHIIASTAVAPVSAAMAVKRPRGRQPQAPPVLGVLMACLLGLLLSSMAAWFLAPAYP